MVSRKELQDGVDSFFTGDYLVTNGLVVPSAADIPFGNVGKEMELAMLFIDIRESTKIVDAFRRKTAARMYKSFLWGISKIARDNNGELRSFNGDGVLMVFSGDLKCTNATKAALQFSWFCKEIIKPEIDYYMKRNLKSQDMEFNYGIGIDVGKVLIVRGGIKGDNNNDLVWVGNATNYAVKLSGIKEDSYNIYISEQVYKKIRDTVKFYGNPKKDIWARRFWTERDDMVIYSTNFYWAIV